MNLPNSDFKFGVYSTDGELLKGSLSEYGALAQKLNPKRCAFYVETNPVNALVGTRLIVQIKGGREERAIFFTQYPKTFCKDDPDWVSHFFNSAKQEVESLDSIQYSVLGVWDSGDLNSIRAKTEKNNLLDVLLGRLLNNEKTTVKIPGFSQGISLLEQVISNLCSISSLGFVYAISHYPLADGSDLLLIPDGIKTNIEPNKNNEYVIVNPEIETMKIFYQKFFPIFLQLIKTRFSPPTRDELAITLREKVIDSEYDLSDIYKKSPEKIIELFQNDNPRLLIICKNIFKTTGTLKNIDRDTLSIVYLQAGRQPDTVDTMKDFLFSIYQLLDDPNKDQFINLFQKSHFIWEFQHLFSDIIAFMIRKKRWDFLTQFNDYLRSAPSPDECSKWIFECFNSKNFQKQELDEFLLNLIKLPDDLKPTKELFINTLKKYYTIKRYKSEILEQLDKPKIIASPSGVLTSKPPSPIATPSKNKKIGDTIGESPGKSNSKGLIKKYFFWVLIAIVFVILIASFSLYPGIFQKDSQTAPQTLTLKLLDESNHLVQEYTLYIDRNLFDVESIKSGNESILKSDLIEKFWTPSIKEATLTDNKNNFASIKKPADDSDRDYLFGEIRKFIEQNVQKK